MSEQKMRDALITAREVLALEGYAENNLAMTKIDEALAQKPTAVVERDDIQVGIDVDGESVFVTVARKEGETIHVIYSQAHPIVAGASETQEKYVADLENALRFMACLWSQIDDWAYKNCDGEALCKYPVLQGTSNQMSLMRIGKQPFNTLRVAAVMKRLDKGV